MRMLARTLFLCALFCFFTPCRTEEPKQPELKAAKVEKDAPKIDGVLDDDAWKSAASAKDFFTDEGAAAQGKTRVLVTQDEKNLYVAIEGFEDEATLKGLTANVAQHDGDEIWQDDEMELFLDPTGKRNSYYQIIVNSKGVTWDAWHDTPKNPDTAWEPKYQSAVKIGEKSWVAEFALPWGIFEKTEKFEADWVFNVIRERKAAGEGCYWSSVMGKSAHAPERFGKLTGIIGVKPPKAEAKTEAKTEAPAVEKK